MLKWTWSRDVVLESGTWIRVRLESRFLGLGLETCGLGLGFATYGLGLGLDTSLNLNLGVFYLNKNTLTFKVFFYYSLIESPDSQSEIRNNVVLKVDPLSSFGSFPNLVCNISIMH